eukprot:TRINITY_DN10420_c0_g1_i1.p1 TRINITY_DN10420_c0_g1~~TRINITY_DN10420_c0_g1_i1.p1  ORF type:complete len:117 (-),score=12.07 TRINITY_DN10420_c0_g1_i1:88-438(-)
MTSTVPILGVCIRGDTLTQDPESSVLRKNRFSRVHSFCRVESPESSACSGQVCSESFGEGIAHHKLSLGQIAHHHIPIAQGEHGLTIGLSLIHISEPTRLLSISYAVFCLKKKKTN